MSQRDSGYRRKERDFYETPWWVTETLIQRVRLAEMCRTVWEPAQGTGKMARVLEAAGFRVIGSDIDDGTDFLSAAMPAGADAIVTNPPYELGQEFCERALQHAETVNGVVAMLLRTDFDHAKRRTHLFRDCPAFSKKLVLMQRIAWFVEADGKPRASPSFNHAWYIWDWKNAGPPTIVYGP